MKICRHCDSRFEEAGYKCPSCGHEPTSWNGLPCFAPALAFENDGFDPRFFAAMTEAAPRHFWLRQRTAVVLWALNKYFPGRHRGLDVGCGGGLMMRAIRARRPDIALDGADLFVSALALAAEGLPETARLMQMDAAALPFESEYDLIGLFDVLEHVDDDDAALAGAALALRPGGGLLLTVPQHRFLWSHLDERVRHRRRYSAAPLRAKLAAAGLRVEASVSYVSLLLPAMVLARFAYRGSDRPEDMLRLNGAVNAVFKGICALERGMIRSRLRLPFGDSLLIVARRADRASEGEQRPLDQALLAVSPPST